MIQTSTPIETQESVHSFHSTHADIDNNEVQVATLLDLQMVLFNEVLEPDPIQAIYFDSTTFGECLAKSEMVRSSPLMAAIGDFSSTVLATLTFSLNRLWKNHSGSAKRFNEVCS
ncbi:hypothetical protein L1987_48585 [Smallanthus sonchifolius]|uniref:Uncharacterized protein n=1 Tax=Smallanthus sonchifolius TaxID=185202 RepID=A0ACB9FU02_9ASTR|nr:hypothetical protein L1987_48585 [Smallanthus sonchifolius]